MYNSNTSYFEDSTHPWSGHKESSDLFFTVLSLSHLCLFKLVDSMILFLQVINNVLVYDV